MLFINSVIIHANLVNFFHKSRDFSERVRDTAFLHYVTLILAFSVC